MYKQYASPFVRVVRGRPVSWEPAAATIYIDNGPGTFAWSPCNRFIAVTNNKSVKVLDAVTLSSLHTFEHFGDHCGPPCFSPDSRCLTQFVDDRIINWDLQTGAPCNVISELGQKLKSFGIFSSACSNDGKVVAVLRSHCCSCFFSYDLHSQTYAGVMSVPEGKITYPIWTHNEHFRFATVHRDSIRIWQSQFTLEHPSVEVESFPIPEEIGYTVDFLFLPALSRLASIYGDSIQIWDVKASKLLLKSKFKPSISMNIQDPLECSFSSDGRFFASINITSEVHIWKESPTGYVLHQQLQFFANPSQPQLSPNGKSIIVSLPSRFYQWHTGDQDLSLPSMSTRDTNWCPFTLGFSPDEKFAVFAQREGNMVTVVDLQSGEQRWITNMDVQVDCLEMTEDTVVVGGVRKITFWNLPGRDCTSHTSVNNSSQLILHGGGLQSTSCMSISPDLSHIVVARKASTPVFYNSLEVHDLPAGMCTWTGTTNVMTLLFTQDGHKVWAGSDGSFREQSKIIEDSKSGIIELNTQTTEVPLKELLWESSHGYEVTDCGWVLSPTQKHLLWLPHHWRSHREERKWGGRFLGLLHLPEVIILEFFE